MKNKIFVRNVMFLSLIIGLFSCKHQPAHQTVRGCVADASMNNVMIITENGDTLNISTMDADPAKVKGVMLRDMVEITYVKEKMENAEVLKAEKLVVTTHSPYYFISGTWLEPNPIDLSDSQGVILKEDGSAESVGMATLLFKKWELSDDNKLLLTYESIGNRQTLKGVDTMQMEKLDADSLVLSRDGYVIWRFARKK